MIMQSNNSVTLQHRSGDRPLPDSRLAVAPMMACTDRHCRYFHRLMSRHALLFTEMVSASAILHGNAARLLAFDAAEHPVGVQIGGSDPAQLRAAARLAARAGYDEINFNCGCPSPRVREACFGAVLMTRPDLAASCVSAMIEGAREVPVTVKCRIGVDDDDPRERLPEFLEFMQRAGVQRVTIHARKAILEGLSPKNNRRVPPLDHALALSMKTMFPALKIVINGGIDSLVMAQDLLDHGADGTMIGRAAYERPCDILLAADASLFGGSCGVRPEDIVERMIPYIERHVQAGEKAHRITRHMMGLFAGRAGARQWRRALSEVSQTASAKFGWLARVRDPMACAEPEMS